MFPISGKQTKIADTPSSNQGIDLRTLRAVRVLRPLKLVSGIPSNINDCDPVTSLYFTIW